MDIKRIQLIRTGKKRYTPLVVAMEGSSTSIGCHGTNKVDGVTSIHLCDENINETHNYRIDIPADKMDRIVASYLKYKERA